MNDENLFKNEGLEFGSDKAVEESDDYELIEEGEYEVVLEKVEKKKSSKDNEYLNVTFKIRDDVNQKFQKRKLWYTIFKRDGDAAFNFNKINEIIITQEGRKDYKRYFKDVDEVFQYLIGLHLKLKVGVEFNQFKGVDGNVIIENSFAPSECDDEVTSPFLEVPPTAEKKPEDITADDLF